MDYEAIEIKNDGAVAWLTLNRPHNLNALSAQMVAELEDFLHRLPTQTETRVVVMKGAGRAFCAGLDLKEQNRGGTGLGASTTDTVESQRRMSDWSSRCAVRRSRSSPRFADLPPAAASRSRSHATCASRANRPASTPPSSASA